MVKNLPAKAGDSRDTGPIAGSGRSPGAGNGISLQYSCLGNPMDRGAWQAVGYGVPESDMSERTHTHVLSTSPSCLLLPHLLSGSTHGLGENLLKIGHFGCFSRALSSVITTSVLLCCGHCPGLSILELPALKRCWVLGPLPEGSWCVCVCVCVYSALYIKEEVHTSGARTELGVERRWKMKVPYFFISRKCLLLSLLIL